MKNYNFQPNEALQILDEVAAGVPANRDGHERLKQASQVLWGVINKFEEAIREIGDRDRVIESLKVERDEYKDRYEALLTEGEEVTSAPEE